MSTVLPAKRVVLTEYVPGRTTTSLPGPAATAVPMSQGWACEQSAVASGLGVAYTVAPLARAAQEAEPSTATVKLAHSVPIRRIALPSIILISCCYGIERSPDCSLGIV